MRRILLNPAAPEGTAPAAPAPAPSPPTPSEPPKPAPLHVDPADYARTFQELEELRRFKATADAERQAALDAERQKSLQATAEKDGIVAALREQEKELKAREESERKRATDLEAEWLAEKKENVLATAMAGRTFASSAAQQQALVILSSRFSVRREDGRPVVRDRDGRFAPETVPSLLDSPEFAHFIAPTSRGGAGAKGGDRPAPDPEALPPSKNLGESLIRRALSVQDDRMPMYTPLKK